MCRHFRITNWLVGMATFGLGVLISNPFLAEAIPFASDENITVRYESKTCVDAPHDVFRHSEQERILEDKIHDVEHRLIEVMRRGGIYARKSEKQLELLERELEDKLRILQTHRDKLIRKGVIDTSGTLKLVKREVCYED